MYWHKLLVAPAGQTDITNMLVPSSTQLLFCSGASLCCDWILKCFFFAFQDHLELSFYHICESIQTFCKKKWADPVRDHWQIIPVVLVFSLQYWHWCSLGILLYGITYQIGAYIICKYKWQWCTWAKKDMNLFILSCRPLDYVEPISKAKPAYAQTQFNND